MRIVVLSDIHGADRPYKNRRCDMAERLLARAVESCNSGIRPDVALLTGDVIDDCADPAASERLRRLRDVLDRLDAPLVAVPGNHDFDALAETPDPSAFYAVFDDPRPWIDIGGVRFLCFVDGEEPGWNGRRSAEDLRLPARARASWDGPVVAVQHESLVPPGAADCRFNFVNADAVVESYRAAGVSLSISGHDHPGVDHVRARGMDFCIAPGLCEPPFSFLEIESAGAVSVRRRNLDAEEQPPETREAD